MSDASRSNLIIGNFGGRSSGPIYIGHSGSGGGGGGDMERIAKLESDMEFVKRDISELRGDMKLTRSDISDLKVKAGVLEERVSHLPTKSWMVGGLGTALTIIAALITFSDKLHTLIK